MSDLIWTPIKIRLGQIKPWTDNPRMSSKAQAERLIQSEQELGQIQTLAVSPFDGDFVDLYDGHQRYSAWLTVKDRNFEVTALQSSRPLHEDERRKVSILLHTATGGWNWQAMSGWSVGELKQWGLVNQENVKGWNMDANNVKELLAAEIAESVDAEPQIDRAAELQVKWQTELGQLWQLGAHRLLIGDCTVMENVERLMGGEKACMVFTDPPWNVAIGKDSKPRHRQREGLQNDDMSDEEYTSFVSSFVSSFVDICDGDVYCKVASEYMDIIGGIFREKKYHWSATIIWVKDIFVLGRSKYHRRYEPIWYGWHNKTKSSFCERRDLDDVWEIDRPRVSDEHPTMMPVELPAKAISNSSVEGGAVYEPFAGSGTTIIAAENLGRRCYAMEISPNYCAVVLQRFHDAFPDEEIKLI